VAERCLGLLIAPLFTIILPFNVGMFLLRVGIIALLIQIYHCYQDKRKRDIKMSMPFKIKGSNQGTSKLDYLLAIKCKREVPFAVIKQAEWKLQSLGDWFVSSWSNQLSKIHATV
jgi:hypothetical protein